MLNSDITLKTLHLSGVRQEKLIVVKKLANKKIKHDLI